MGPSAVQVLSSWSYPDRDSEGGFLVNNQRFRCYFYKTGVLHYLPLFFISLS